MGLASYYNRDYDQAIAYLQKTLELDPDFPPAHGQLPAAFEQKGMYDKAIAGFQKGITWKIKGVSACDHTQTARRP